MLLRLLRHATLVVEYGGRRLLVDPMLGPASSQPPMPDTDDPRPNPLVDLPMAAESAVEGVSAVVVTHLHGDHIDAHAAGLLPRDRPVVCQPRDAAAFASRGLPVVPLQGEVPLDGLRMTRTGGRHGTGAIGREMGEVSGFVLAAEGEPTLYVAGDTVWCDEVRTAIAKHRPDVIVVNAGAARFLAGDPITMDAGDVVEVLRAAPESLVVAVHMEAMSHCGLTRAALRQAVAAEGLDGRLQTPADGETLRLAFS
jgi:L-ascorbate metabolism protein UlaG (beta-lactamase superfamily)